MMRQIFNRQKITKTTFGFYDFFDPIARYLYSRLPFFKKILFWHWYQSKPALADQIFETRLKPLFEKYGQSFKNKVCLEIGPGNSLLLAGNLLLTGAKKVILVDKYPRFRKSASQKKFQRRELTFLKKKFHQPLFFLSGDNWRRECLEFYACDLTEIEPEPIDFIYSISVLEQLSKPAENIRQMSRILRPGGLMFHVIDFRDSLNFRRPFFFYRYEKNVWEKYLTREGVNYRNRLRLNDFMTLFKRYNFDVLERKIYRQPLNPHIKIASCFATNREDLDVAVAEILLIKK